MTSAFVVPGKPVGKGRPLGIVRTVRLQPQDGTLLPEDS